MRILVFGDSITYGKVDTQGGWANRIRKHFDELAAKNYSRDFPNLYNQGISGDTAEDILRRFDVETESRLDEENVFVLAVGTNDSSLDMGKPRYTEQQFRANFEEILKRMLNHSNKILIVGLLPVDENLTRPIPWRPNRHYTNEQILKFDNVIKRAAKQASLTYVHVFESFKDKLSLFPDGLHPNDEGHELIANIVKPELQKLL